MCDSRNQAVLQEFPIPLNLQVQSDLVSKIFLTPTLDLLPHHHYKNIMAEL